MLEQLVLWWLGVVNNLLICFMSILLPLFILWVLQRFFVRMSVTRPSIFNHTTGLIGVPIHEISHCLCCIIFRHSITKVKLYSWPTSHSKSDVALGYVEHSFNPNSIYQVVGNFFIGIAPIFGGVVATGGVSLALLPGADTMMIRLFDIVNIDPPAGRYFEFYYHLNLALISELLSSLQSDWLQSPIQVSIWVFVVGAIGLYLSPSNADLLGSLKGGMYLLGFLILTDVVLGNQAFYGYLTTVFMGWSALLVVCIFMSATVLSMLCVINKLITH